MSWLSIPALSKLQVVWKTILFLPKNILSSCSVRALQGHYWLLPVIAYRWQMQRTPRMQRLRPAWWSFGSGLEFCLFVCGLGEKSLPDLFWGFVSILILSTDWKNKPRPLCYNPVRRVKEQEGGQKAHSGPGSRQVGCGAFSPMRAGIKVTHWYINAEAWKASPTFPAREIIYYSEMTLRSSQKLPLETAGEAE